MKGIGERGGVCDRGIGDNRRVFGKTDASGEGRDGATGIGIRTVRERCGSSLG